MNWMMIKLVSALLSLTLTGSAAFLLWYALSRFLKKWGYVRWCHAALWGVGLLYMIPVAYGAMRWLGESGRWGGVLFWPTLTITEVTGGLLAVWGIGAGLMCCRLVSISIRQSRRRRREIPCEEGVERLFLSVQQELGLVLGKVGLVCDYLADAPVFTGIFHPRVVLPPQHFTEEQLRVIFFHELTHYRQRDIYLLAFAMLIQVFQWFQPCVWLFRKEVSKYGEYACDEKVCGRAGGIKKYFDTILDVMCVEENRDGIFSMHMMERKHELVRRKKQMRDTEKRKKKPMAWAAALSIGMAICCSITVMAAADEMGRQYQDWYQATVIEVEEPYEPIEYEEFTDHGPAEGITVEEGETTQVARSLISFTWTIPSNTSKKTSGFSAQKGQTVSVSAVVDPSTKEVMVGIMDSAGNRRYIIGHGSISHDFEIKSTDTYRVFVENTNSSTVYVNGNYSVHLM